ncbi:hypothetical protein ABIC09_003412 [Bradyrhizobium sp. S3.12.5]
MLGRGQWDAAALRATLVIAKLTTLREVPVHNFPNHCKTWCIGTGYLLPLHGKVASVVDISINEVRTT